MARHAEWTSPHLLAARSVWDAVDAVVAGLTMPFPETRAGMEAAGYRFDSIGQCRGARCHADLHWWVSPKGKRIPMNPDLTPHHATCPDVAQFRPSRPST